MKTNPTLKLDKRAALLLLVLSIFYRQLPTAFAQGTGFTYQGRLTDGANTANGSYVFRFTVYDQATGGGIVGTNITTSPVSVTNGLFTVMLDFGGGLFTGANRWLSIEVHTNQMNLAFIPLTPRQPVLPTPYAIYAGSVDPAGISGVVPSALSASYATNFSGALTGDVTGTQSATVVSGVGGQSATNVASGVSAANAGTAANVFGTIVKRDGNGDFSAGSATLGGALYLPFPAIIYAGTNTVFVAQGSVFVGTDAGVGAVGFGNVGVGDYVLSSGNTGFANTAIGELALLHNTSGRFNTATGFDALNENTTGNDNTANGLMALQKNRSGDDNTASGSLALHENTGGSGNTANGFAALYNNVIGNFNTAIGWGALNSNIGSENTASGYAALNNNLDGSRNTASGSYALDLNRTGNDNTANGYNALFRNLGSYNTASGSSALQENTTGFQNTANGAQALASNMDGSYNTASGYGALSRNTSGGDNTAFGDFALGLCVSGGGNIAIGSSAGYWITTGIANIDIGNEAVFGDNRIIRIGDWQTNTFIAGISGATAASGVAVYVNSDGKLGTLTSSARFKENIESMNDASRVLYLLHPVTFRYKPELDPQAIPQFGLVAEEVEKVDPDLVARDDKNQVYTVRYEAVNAMLLNEFLKQHRKVEEQNTEIQTLKKQNGSLEKRLDELARTVQALAERK